MGRLGPFSRVAIEPPPPDGLAEGSGEHGMVSTDAGRLQRPVPPLARRQLPVPLVEVPGRQLADRDVTELGEDGRLGRPSGVMEGPRSTAPCLAVAEPLLDQGADGRRRVRGDPVVVQFLLPRPERRPGFGLVLGLDGLGALPGVPGDRVGSDKHAEAPRPRASLLNRPCTLGSSRRPGRWSAAHMRDMD